MPRSRNALRRSSRVLKLNGASPTSGSSERAATSLTSLNYDVLSEILELLSSHEKRRLASTCRSLRDMATRPALREVNIGYAPERFKLFCDYVFADIPNRVHAVRHFSIDLHWTSKTISTYGALLVKFLSNATSLRSLVLTRADERICVIPGIGDALSGLHELVALDLAFMDNAISDFVDSMQCSLHSCRLVPTYRNTYSFHSALSHLSTFQHSLRSITFYGLTMEKTSPATLCFPNVQHLTMHEIRGSMDPIILAFPALRVLRLVSSSNVHVFEMTEFWPHLDCCELDASAFHVPVLSSVHTLNLECLNESILTTIRHTSPVVLSVQIGYPRPWEAEIRLMTQLALSMPQCRRLKLSFKESDSLGSILRYLQKPIGHALSPLNLLCLEVEISCHYVWGGVFGSGLDLRQRDEVMDTLPGILADSVASLKFVSIHIGDALWWYPRESKAQWLKRSWLSWRIGASSGKRTLLPITAEAFNWVTAQMADPHCDFSRFDSDDASVLPRYLRSGDP